MVHRERAGLVGAEHVHRAEVLDGVEPLDDDLLLRHRQRALGEADRDDHRQHFRRQADGHGQREEEAPRFQLCLVRPLMRNTSGTITAMKRIISQVNWLTPLSKLVGGLLAGEAAGHAAEVGLCAGGDDHRRGRAALHAGAQKADVASSSSGDRPCARLRGVELFDRQRFAGEAGLDDEQVLGRQSRTSPGIMSPAASLTTSPGTSSLSGISRGWPSRTTVAVTLDHGLELGGGVVGPRFLDETQAPPAPPSPP